MKLSTSRLMSGALAATVLLSAVMLAAVGAAVTSDYESEIQRWREQREARLKADGGWLTVAGLFWLHEGANRFGTDASNDIVLPPGSAPTRAGEFQFHEGKTAVSVLPGVTVTAEGKPITWMDLQSDAAGKPDLLALGSLTMQVIQRGERYGIRLKDMNSRFRKEFTGLRWFPIKGSYRLNAKWVPYDPPKEISVPTILGTTEKMPCPGAAVFTLDGQELRLEPVLEEPDAKDLFFIFRDGTAGVETYPSGRFLYADLPKEGGIVLDFNKAYSPPCAFTPYATCPLPPAQNQLAARIEAGELRYGDH